MFAQVTVDEICCSRVEATGNHLILAAEANLPHVDLQITIGFDEAPRQQFCVVAESDLVVVRVIPNATRQRADNTQDE